MIFQLNTTLPKDKLVPLITQIALNPYIKAVAIPLIDKQIVPLIRSSNLKVVLKNVETMDQAKEALDVQPDAIWISGGI